MEPNPVATPPSGWARIFKSQQAGIAALFVTLATLLSTILGLVRNKVMAHYFGASLETDIYNFGITIPDSLQSILIMGVTASSFIPIYAEYVANHTREEANRLASNFLNATLLAFTGICIVVGITMPFLTDLWLGDIPAESKLRVIFITRLFLVSQIAFALSKILSGILQTHKHFTAYALALLVYNPAIILGMVLFHGALGIESAAYGAVFGACLVVIVNVVDSLGTEYRHQRLIDFRHPGFVEIYKLAIPNFLNMGLLQTVFIAYSKISVDLPAGSYSAFRYALDFESFPVSVFGISFVTAIFPYLAENASRKNYVNFNYNIQNSIRQILYLTLPAGVGMAILSNEIIGLILGGGRFGQAEIEMTSGILFFYAMIVPLESLWYLFARAFYATKDTWTPFWYRLAGTVVNLFISVLLAPRLGPSAFSLGLLIAFSIQIVLFVFGLKRKVAEFDIRMALITAGKLLGCSLGMGVVVWASVTWMDDRPWILARTIRMQYLIKTLIGMGIGASVYFVLTIVFKCADFSVLGRVVDRVLGRNKKSDNS